jgi:Mlc titration factor MtfA (ptsG expression regulator)
VSEFIGWLLGIVLMLVLVATVVINFYQVIRAIVNYFLKDFINRHLIFRKLNPASKAFLETSFKYYQRLNDDDKLMFERRVQKFIKMKEFVARGELSSVTTEMKTLIAAAAIQITFGLPSIYFSHFYKILVYPDSYYSTVTHHYHQGEVNTRGFIVLSWKNLLQGYMDDSDGRNLGLHEMAHALKIVDAIRSDDYDLMDTGTFNKFIRHARIEMQRIADGHDSFFRDYAATNDYEFFAVAVENFFERSQEFESHHPELYGLLCELLNQNPLTGR